MDNNPDEIILLMINELPICDVLKMRSLNTQLYRCSFNTAVLAKKVAALFKSCKACNLCDHALNEKIFEMVHKIPNFDFTINNNYAIEWASELWF